jgi:dephospho-CoA kinase
VVEIPLLFEKNLTTGFEFVVCVACSEEMRRSRLLEKGLTVEDISHRIASQMPLSEKVKRSDIVFWNDGEPGFLRAQVAALVGRLPAP